jgi:hypothetical protein
MRLLSELLSAWYNWNGTLHIVAAIRSEAARAAFPLAACCNAAAALDECGATDALSL